MKKLFIPLVILILFTICIFNFDIVFSAVDDNFPFPSCISGQCYCETTEFPYLDKDRGLCIGENDVSLKEERNINNIKSMSLELANIRNDYVSYFMFLSEGLRNILITKLSSYYDVTFSVSTSTVKSSIPRAQRDTFFRDKYVPHLGLTKAVDILGKYNSLGGAIQNLIILANTTDLYIQSSAIVTDMGDASASLRSAITILNDYIDTVDSDLVVLGSVVSGFDVNNFYSFKNFSDSYGEYEASFKASFDLYLGSKDAIIDIAMQAIKKVEAAYNENSSITASPAIIYNDGSVSVVTVTVKNSLNNPIVGRLVTLNSSKNVNINPISAVTDSNGVALFNVSYDNLGFISLNAEIEGEELVISGSYLIEVIENPAIKGCTNSGGTWDGTTCKCLDGFVWDDVKLQCVESGITEEICVAGGGTWDGKICKCETGFVWDDVKLQCVESGITEEICVAGGGTWDDKTLTCKCETGFVWNDIQLKCILFITTPDITPKEACERDKGKWDEEQSTCICLVGFYWDDIKLQCLKCVIDGTICVAGGGKWDDKTLTCTCVLGYWDCATSKCVNK